ncbi:MAG: NAD-dependent epimerase/dehydratase family protein [Pseudomonadota bacterium]
MKIAISGATGFVGSAAARCASERGHKLIRILRPGSGKQGSEDICADLEDADCLSELASRVDAVIHCAASDDPAFLPISQAAIDAFIKGLPPGGRLAMHSGSVVFGDTGPEAEANPAFSPPPPLKEKTAFDQHVLKPGRTDIYTRVVYGSFIYGGEGAAIPSVMIRTAMKTGSALFFDQGEQVWSTAHVSDFSTLLVDAVESEAPENICLFAAGRAVQLKPVADIIGQVLGVPSRPVCSDEEAGLFGPFAGPLTMNQHFSSETTRQLVRWYPELSDEAVSIIRALTRQASRTML